MSDLWVNIRIMYWHIQIGRSRKRISYNQYQKEARQNNSEWKRFEVYQFFGLERILNK